MNDRLNPNSELEQSIVSVPDLAQVPEEFLNMAQQFQEAMMMYTCALSQNSDRAHLYTLTGVCALPRACLRTGILSRAPIWRLCRNKGLHPLRRLRGYPCTPTKTVHPPLASVPFLRVLLSYPGGDTHSHLPLEHRYCEPRKRQISRCRSRLPKRRKADKRMGRNDP